MHSSKLCGALGVLLSFLLLAIGPVRAADLSPRQLVGSSAPDWQLESLDGHKHTLRQYRGRAVVLTFWAAWCAACHMEANWLNELYAEYQKDGLEILGVSMDEPGERAAVEEFVKRHRVSYAILLHGQSIAEGYAGVPYLPQTFFIDRNGKIANATAGIHDKATLAAEVRAILASVRSTAAH